MGAHPKRTELDKASRLRIDDPRHHTAAVKHDGPNSRRSHNVKDLTTFPHPLPTNFPTYAKMVGNY